jgi:hypothetical protein
LQLELGWNLSLAASSAAALELFQFHKMFKTWSNWPVDW